MHLAKGFEYRAVIVMACDRDAIPDQERVQEVSVTDEADMEDVCDDVMVIFGGTVQTQGKMSELLADNERVKVEFSAKDKGKIEKVKEILGDSADFSSPKQSLESFFLKIVNESSRKLTTAGAQMGTGVAAYLKGDTAPKVIIQEKPAKSDTYEPPLRE